MATNFEQKMQAALTSWKTMFTMARGRMICFTGITVMAPKVKFSHLPSCIPKTWGCGVGPPLEPSIHAWLEPCGDSISCYGKKGTTWSSPASPFLLLAPWTWTSTLQLPLPCQISIFLVWTRHNLKRVEQDRLYIRITLWQLKFSALKYIPKVLQSTACHTAIIIGEL